jgi:hypothetical protein
MTQSLTENIWKLVFICANGADKVRAVIRAIRRYIDGQVTQAILSASKYFAAHNARQKMNNTKGTL